MLPALFFGTGRGRLRVFPASHGGADNVPVRALGYVVLAGVASQRSVARYRSLGLPFEIIGPARDYWGAPRRPVRLDTARAERPGWFDGP